MLVVQFLMCCVSSTIVSFFHQLQNCCMQLNSALDLFLKCLVLFIAVPQTYLLITVLFKFYAIFRLRMFTKAHTEWMDIVFNPSSLLLTSMCCLLE